MSKRVKRHGENDDLLDGEDGDGLDTPNSMLMMPQQLGVSENADLIDGDDDDLEDDDQDEDPLLAEVAELRQKLEAQQESFNNTLLQLASRPANPNSDQAIITPELDFSDLPDPVEDKDGFTKKLGEKVHNYTQQYQQSTQSTQQLQQALNDMDSQFKRDYAEIADKSILFQAAVTQEVQRVKGMGLDPKQFLFANRDKFLKDVAKRMYDELGMEPGSGDDGDEDGSTVRKPKIRINKKSANRTGGLHGASRPGAGDRKGKDKKPVGFIDQLKQTQLAEGLL